MAKTRTNLVAILAGCALALPALAQDGAAPGATPMQDAQAPGAAPPPAPSPSNTALNTTAATSLARLALLDVRGIQNPTPDDFTICGLLLKAASAWSPSNTQVLRARIEAAHSAGNQVEVLAATRDLVRADPSDTVAQLRLISSRMSQMQTAQERAEAYRQFLGKQGSRLDSSIRSRLALDAAMLARELGDEKGFVTYLKQATSLDATNKDAALLALSYFSESVDNRTAHFELLTNVFYADPLDPGVMMQLRDELAAADAWDQAQRFHKMAVNVLAARSDISVDDRLADHGITWHMKGPGEVLSLLNTDLAAMRDRQERMFSQKTQTMTSGYDMRRAEDVRLSLPMDQLRLVAALTLNDTEVTARVIKDLIATNAETSSVLADAARRPQSMNEQDAAQKTLELRVELCVWRLLAKDGVDEVVAMAPELRAALGDDDDLTAILDAWTALRTGNGAEAERIAAESGVISSWLGVAAALAREERGDTAGAAAVLRQVAEDEPLTALGCYAWSRAKSLDAAYVNPLTAQIDRLARDVPLWVDAMIARPTQHQRLIVDLAQRDAKAMDPVTLTVRLRNLSPVPLALGTDLALNARLMIIPSIQTGETELIRHLSPDVVMLDQRLRLMPGEELSLVMDPAIGSVGWVAGTASSKPVTEKYRVLQGFVAGDEGARSAGPGCVDVTSLTLSRDAYDPSRSDPAALAQRIAAADEATLVKFAVASRALLVPAQLNSSIGDAHDALAAAWAARFPTLSVQAKVAVLCELPPAREVMAMKPLDDVAGTDADLNVLRAYIATQADLPEDPAITRAIAAGDADLATLATLHRARLEAGVRAYATQGVTAGIAAARTGGR
ncbi:MAG TPA: hypothetical protein VHN77_01050 [Phycisphaerales bacterium]|nr:hypothetical protein [Phycisphaerales bacterium]